jgi:formate dehydrogenase subunit gamma
MRSDAQLARRTRRWRSMMWSLLAIIVLAMALPSLGYLVAHASQSPAVQAFGSDRDTNPRSDAWRGAREGNAGTTTQTGPFVTNTLISNVGQNWRQLRTGPLTTYGAWYLLGALLLVAGFFALFGRQRIADGRSGITVRRWSAFERIVHWFTAISFVVLAITGLSLLFGRTVLIPLLGPSGFAAYAQVGMNVHNFLGPAFSVGVLLMIVMWARHNIPKRYDLEWFKQGGGITDHDKHPPAGKANGGEKVWFWLGVFAMGLTVIVTGFILDFPNLGFQTREMMAYSQLIHAGVALLWIGFWFGHAYIGTLGSEGALEGMTRGRVDVNWAKQHHGLWYDEIIARGEQPQPEQPVEDKPVVTPAPKPAA